MQFTWINLLYDDPVLICKVEFKFLIVFNIIIYLCIYLKS